MRNPKIQPLVSALQRELGLTITKGQIVLNIADGGMFQNAEYRVYIDGQESGSNGQAANPLDSHRLMGR